MRWTAGTGRAYHQAMGDDRTSGDHEAGDGPLIAAAALTERQLSVYRLSRDGMSVPEIARRLEVSDNTARDCLAQVRRKVALTMRRAEARAAANASRTTGGDAA
jgi:DNA-binding NarL/FixJ family response regulator